MTDLSDKYPKGYIPKSKEKNRRDSAKYYNKNKAEIQAKRAAKRLAQRFNVRQSTIDKYSLSQERVEEELEQIDDMDPSSSGLEDESMFMDEQDGNRIKPKITLKDVERSWRKQAKLHEQEGSVRFKEAAVSGYVNRLKQVLGANGCSLDDIGHCFDDIPKLVANMKKRFSDKSRKDYYTAIVNLFNHEPRMKDYYGDKLATMLDEYRKLMKKESSDYMDKQEERLQKEPLLFTWPQFQDAITKTKPGSMAQLMMHLYQNLPLRNDYNALHLVKQKKEATDKNKNYYVTNTNTIVLHKPKKASNFKKLKLPVEVKITNKKLLSMISKSLKAKPKRKYLVTAEDGKQLSNTTSMRAFVQDIFEDIGLPLAKGKKFVFNDIRRARVAHEYDPKRKVPRSQKKKLAADMLHSEEMQMFVYNHPEAVDLDKVVARTSTEN